MSYNLAGRRLELEMHTRRHGANGAFFGDLQVTARTEADTIEEAVADVIRGREMAIIVAVAVNAAIAPLEAELAYETTEGIEDREFFQRFVPQDEISYADRVVPIDATAAVLTAVARHPQRDRLVRAIMQYSEALQRWDDGNELLVLAHLFMGVEAIKKACWRVELANRCMTKEELASKWGFEPDNRLRIDEFLDKEARLRLVFRGDALHHRIAKDVSDKFEHGFENGGKLFKPAASALIPSATYLRDAILELLNLPEKHLSKLKSETYSNPRGPAGLEQYLRGRLIAPAGERLAADGQEHPFCFWQVEVEAHRRQDGTHEYEHKPTLTAVIGPGVTLQPLQHEVYARGTFKPMSAGEAQRPPDADQEGGPM